MSDHQKLRDKLVKLALIPRKIDVLVAKTKGVKIRKKAIDKFSLEELETALQELNFPKIGRTIVQEFLEYLRSKEDSILKLKPLYVNVKFKISNLKRINEYISSREDITSFRSFIISALCKEFGIEPKGSFSVKSKKKITSPQILIPIDLIEEVKERLSKGNRRPTTKEAVKVIRRKIEDILRRMEEYKNV